MDTTLVGVVMNGLSHLHDIQSKEHFALGLVRGLGGNLPVQARERFAKEVRVFWKPNVSINIQSKEHFALGLVRGLGGNLPVQARERFAKEVRVQ